MRKMLEPCDCDDADETHEHCSSCDCVMRRDERYLCKTCDEDTKVCFDGNIFSTYQLSDGWSCDVNGTEKSFGQSMESHALQEAMEWVDLKLREIENAL